MELVDASIIEARSMYLEGPRLLLHRSNRCCGVFQKTMEEFSTAAIYYSNGICHWNRSCGGYLPLKSMLLEPPNRCLGGLDRSYIYMGSRWWIPMEFHGAVWRILLLQYSRLEGLVGPVGHCYHCSCGRGSPQSIRIDLWAL